MNENTTAPDDSGKEEPNSGDIFESTRNFADKAEDFVAQTTAKIRDSEKFSSLKDALKKAEHYMEGKSIEFNNSKFADKLDAFADRTISEADKLFQKAKDAGREMADEVDEAINSIREKTGKNKK